MGILSFLLGATVAGAPLPQAALPQAASLPQALATASPAVRIQRYPALWVVNDDDTIIYLFGTFHALDANSAWFAQAVRTAFFASDKLVLETLIPRPPGLGPPPAPRAAPPGGIGFAPPAAADPGSSPSFMASTELVMDAGRTRGLSTVHGADAVLRDTADLHGKPVAALESFQAQMDMMTSLPRSSQPIPSARDPQAMQVLGQLLTNLQLAWSRGDIDTFEAMLTRMRSQSPQLYRTMFVERNTRWAAWIADQLKTPGTMFVAVGTGHLSGPDSVQNKLAIIGVRSARVN
ncbi:MAG TPA: TraB/GumN family protein [Sphingomicrobium sp.]|nr:TraB/GumN family protein [Sphingomicrobium sp.]